MAWTGVTSILFHVFGIFENKSIFLFCFGAEHHMTYMYVHIHFDACLTTAIAMEQANNEVNGSENNELEREM